jgi:hypothetical protein
MEILYPNFLWALLAISIPIAIHLFNFRKYTTLLYSDVSLLKTVQEKTKKQRNLKHLLVLAARTLAIVFLVLAFAQPYIPASDANEDSTVLIILDNSASMLAIDKKGENLNYAKLKAKEIVKNYASNTLFKLSTHNQLPKHNLLLSKAEILSEIDLLDVAHNSIGLENLTSVSLKFEEFDRVFIVSDFQKLNLNVDKLDSSSGISFIPLPTDGVSANVGIDSVWLENPIALEGFDQSISALVTNYSNTAANELSVSLEIENELTGAFTVDIAPKGKTIVNFKYQPQTKGALEGVVKIIGPKLRFDDERYFSLRIAEERSVSIINSGESSKVVTSVFADDFVTLHEMRSTNLNLEVIAKSDLIVLDHLVTINSQLVDVLAKNTEINILVIPSYKADLKSYKNLEELDINSLNNRIDQKTEISEINIEDPYFYSAFGKNPKNLNISGVQSHFTVSSGLSYPLVKLKNGSPLALRFENNNRNVVVLTSGLTKEFGTWFQSNLIYPLLYQSVLFKTEVDKPSFNTNDLGTYSLKHTTDSEKPLKVSFDGSVFIPKQQTFPERTDVLLDNQFRTKGFYNVFSEADTLGLIAVNIPTRESSIEFYTEEDFKLTSNWKYIDGDVTELGSSISSLVNGVSYWKQCLLLALLFLLFEIVLLRFAKSV